MSEVNNINKIDLSFLKNKNFKTIIFFGIVLVCLFFSVYQVEANENAVVLRLGKYNNTFTSGLHFKIPFIDQVYKVKVDYQYKKEFGFRTLKPNVKYPENIGLELFAEDASEASEKKIGIRLIEKRLTPQEGMLTSDQMQSDSTLSTMTILTARIGSNHAVSDSQAKVLKKLWGDLPSAKPKSISKDPLENDLHKEI